MTDDSELICMMSCSQSNSKATISATGGVDRMTDTKNYTGSHAHRFDESGKGKGAAGKITPYLRERLCGTFL